MEENIEKMKSEDYDILDAEKINRLVLFDFIDETIELCSEDLKNITKICFFLLFRKTKTYIDENFEKT